MIANSVAFIFLKEQLEVFIMGLSVSIVYTVAAALLLLYLAALYTYMIAGKGGKEYAVSK